MSLIQLQTPTKIIALLLTLAAGFMAYGIVSSAQQAIVMQSISIPIAHAQATEVIEGMCGTDDGAIVPTIPTGAGVCTSGTPSAVVFDATAPAGWEWQCVGGGGGVDELALTGTGVIVSVNARPVMNVVTPSRPSALGDTVVLGAGEVTAFDADGDAMTFNWSKTSGQIDGLPILNGNSLTPTFTNLNTVGTYEYTVIATDGSLSSIPRTVSIVVSAAPNFPPTNLNTGGPRSITPPEEHVVISGASATDPEGDPLTVTWSPTGPVATVIPDATDQFAPRFEGMLPNTIYTFEMTVSDGVNPPVSDFMTVTVGSTPPPPTPSGLTVTPGVCDSDTINIDWDDVAVADTYTLRIDGVDVTGIGTSDYAHTVPSDGSVYVYQVAAVDSGVTSATFSPIEVGVAPIDCATANGVNLSSSIPVITMSVASEVNGGRDGTWNNVQVRDITISNSGLGTMPAASSTNFVATLDDILTGPTPEYISVATPDITGVIASLGSVGTFNRALSGVMFGSYDVCVIVNDASYGPDTEEFPASAANNNTSCRPGPAFAVPVPQPPMSISATPALVRSGQAIDLTWSADVNYPTMRCTVSGAGGVNEVFWAHAAVPDSGGGGTTGRLSLPVPINNTSEFSIVCEEQITGESFTETIIVEVVPDTQEF